MKRMTYLKTRIKKLHMINMVIPPLKTVVLVMLAVVQIFHRHFRTYLKIFLGILWEVPLVEALTHLQEEGQI